MGQNSEKPLSDRQRLLSLIAGHSIGVDHDPPKPIVIGYNSAFYLLEALENAGYEFTRLKRKHRKAKRNAK